MLRQKHSRHNNIGQQLTWNASGPNSGCTICNGIQHPVCSANGACTNYPSNRNPLPTCVVLLRKKENIRLNKFPTLQRSAEKFIQVIVPDTCIENISGPFVKFQGGTPYKLFKHLKKWYGILEKLQKVSLKQNFNKTYDPNEAIIIFTRHRRDQICHIKSPISGPISSPRKGPL